ncbi:MAG: hypothetical protein Q8O88_04870 [bacterium]|nr:hypothetical protein [bacterium]
MEATLVAVLPDISEVVPLSDADKPMVDEVVENGGENTIRKYLKLLVRHWAEDYKINQPQIKLTGTEFLEAGFMHLELGLKKYYEKLEKGKVGFKFSTYFEWFIRQGFLDYFRQKSIE